MTDKFVLVPKTAVKKEYFDAPPPVEAKEAKGADIVENRRTSQIGNVLRLNKTVCSTTLSIVNSINCGTSSPTNNGIALQVSGASEFSSFAALFDEYRVDSIDISWAFNDILERSGDGLLVWIHAFDPTLATGMLAGSLADYSNSQIVDVAPGYKQLFHFRVKRPRATVYASDLVIPEWQTTATASTYCYGTDLLSSTGSLTAAGYLTYMIKFHVSFRNRRHA